MRKTCLLVVACAIALGAVDRAFADDAANAVVDKAIKAMGGAAVLAKHRSSIWKERGTYYGMGAGLPYTAEYAIEIPTKFRFSVESAFTIVVNGDKGWANDAEMPKEQLDEQREQLHQAGLTHMLALKDKAYEITSLPELKVDDKPAVGIKVSSKGHRDFSMYFDKESGLLVKTSCKAKDFEQGGKEVTQETYYQAYKDQDGTKIVAKILMLRDEKKFVEAEMIEWKFTDKIDPKLFEKPQ